MVALATTYQWPEPVAVSEAESRVFVPPPKPGILDWGREHFVLPAKTSKISGPWSDEYTPFVRRILTLLERPPVSVWVQACTQGCKTTIVQLLLAYICAVDPGPTGLVMPQETGAKNRIRTKIRPLFEANPVLFDKIGKDVRNLNVGEPTDMGDMILFMMWASSAAQMADHSLQNMIYDEVGKMLLIAATGENPIKLGRNRQRTYETIMRELGVSSPQDEGDIFDVEIKHGTDEQWYTPCMLCGRWHALKTYVDPAFDTYLVLDDAGGQYYPSAVYQTQERSRYVCPLCKGAWSASNRWRSNEAGVWVPAGQTMDPNGQISGPAPQTHQYSFTVHAMMLYPEFASYRKLAYEFVAAREQKQKGDLSLMRDWQRNQRGLPWKEVVRTLDASALLDKVTDRPMGVVPNWCKLLTAGADYHENQAGNVRVEWEVTGWGDDLRNALVACGCSDTLDAMFYETCAASWPWAEPTDTPELMVACGMVDAGYQPNDPHEGIIDVVYDFCLRYQHTRIWLPCKGGKPAQVEKLIYSDLDKVVAEARKKYRRRYAGQYRGMRLVTIAVSQFKDMVTDWAQAPLGLAASTEFPQGLPAEYWKEFTNEQKVRQPSGPWVWKAKEDSAASKSHKLDIRVYATAAAWHKEVYRLWSPQALAGPAAARPRVAAPPRRPMRRPGGGGWLDNLPTL